MEPLHPHVLGCLSRELKAFTRALAGPERPLRFILSDYHRRAYDPDAERRFQALHVDDDYPTLQPNESALAAMVFLNDVPPGGGAFFHIDKSYQRVRAMLAETPGALDSFGAASFEEMFGAATEVTAEAGDVLFIHHLHVHCGSNNTQVPGYTREALLYRIYVEPEPRAEPDGTAPLDRANSFGPHAPAPEGALRLAERSGDDAFRLGEGLGGRVLDFDLCHRDGRTFLYVAYQEDPELLYRCELRPGGGIARVDRMSPEVGAIRSLSVSHSASESRLCVAGGSGAGVVLREYAPGRHEREAELTGVGSIQCLMGSETEASTALYGHLCFVLSGDGRSLSVRGSNGGGSLLQGPERVTSLAGLPFAPASVRMHPCRAEWYFGAIVDRPPGDPDPASLAGIVHDVASLPVKSLEPLMDEEGEPVRSPRVLVRAQDLWLVGYVDRRAGEDRLFFGLLDWTRAARVRRIDSAAAMRRALGGMGYA
ncbi:MAG TPA: hypothetical protein VFQ67_01600 [Allosphingosinicella sp.]|nr:hypothetical protein [Allosphingosinicella sp.]